MARTYVVGIRNAIVSAILGQYGAGPLIRLYDGAVPANRGTALSGQVLIAQWTGAWAAVANGAATFSGVGTSTTEAFGAGTRTATFYRIYDSTGTTCLEQGTVSTPGGGGDATIDNVVFAQSQSVNIGSFSIVAPGA